MSLVAHSFPAGFGQNLGLQTSKEEQSLLGLKQEGYTKLLFPRVAPVWGHGESEAAFCRGLHVSLSATVTQQIARMQGTPRSPLLWQVLTWE